MESYYWKSRHTSLWSFSSWVLDPLRFSVTYMVKLVNAWVTGEEIEPWLQGCKPYVCASLTIVKSIQDRAGLAIHLSKVRRKVHTYTYVTLMFKLPFVRMSVLEDRCLDGVGSGSVKGQGEVLVRWFRRAAITMGYIGSTPWWAGQPGWVDEAVVTMMRANARQLL